MVGSPQPGRTSRLPSPRHGWRFALLLAALLCGAVETPAAPLAARGAAPLGRARVRQPVCGPLPMSFEANRGQAGPRVQFLSRKAESCLFLSPDEAVLSLRAGSSAPSCATCSEQAPGASSSPHEPAQVRMRLVGGNRFARPVGFGRLPGRASYFRGGDPKRWLTGIPLYARAGYRGVYPGVDLLYYSRERQLEYDFVVAPRASPSAIRLRWEGAGGLRIDDQGDLVLRTAAGTLRQRKPRLYQEGNRGRRRIAGGYVLRGRHEVGFRVGAYDRSRPLVIDPVLTYATYLGGSAQDYASAVAVDPRGGLYVTGRTLSIDFPSRASFRTAPHPSPYGGYQDDAFVVKLDPTGTQVLYAAYLGGWGFEAAHAIAVDGTGSAYVTGDTSSYFQAPLVVDGTEISPLLEGFPTTPTAFDPQGHNTSLGPFRDAFLTRISPDGSTLLYSTYLGQQGDESGHGVAIDRTGQAWVVGMTSSNKSDEPYLDWYREFPTTPDALQPHYGGGELDAFVARFDTNASGAASLVYSTYLGGGREDRAAALALDAQGGLYVTGLTGSADFPSTPGAFQPRNHPDSAPPMTNGDAFVTKLDPTGTRVLYSTFLGGSLIDEPTSIAVDGSGSATIAGWTLSNEVDAQPFPTTPGAFQPSKAQDVLQCPHQLGPYSYVLGPCEDGFVAKLNPEGTGLVYSTHIGGGLIDRAVAVAVDGAGCTWVAGQSSSKDLPLGGGAEGLLPGGTEGYLAKLDPFGGVLLLTRTGPLLYGLAPDPAGGVCAVGFALPGLPTTPGAPQPASSGQGDAFVARITDPGPPPSATGPLPPSQRYAVEISVGPVAFPELTSLFLLARATPRPGQPATTLTLEVQGPDGRLLASREMPLTPDAPSLDLVQVSVNPAPGLYMVRLRYPDATLIRAFRRPLMVTNLPKPVPRAAAGADGSLRVDWDAVPNTGSYWVEVYQRQTDAGGQPQLIRVAAGDTEGQVDASLPPAFLQIGETYQVFVYAVTADARAGRLAPTFAGSGGLSGMLTVGGGLPAARGDLNGDGAVDARDAILLLRIAAGFLPPTAEQRESGDLNDDGKLTVQDVIRLLRKVVGL